MKKSVCVAPAILLLAFCCEKEVGAGGPMAPQLARAQTGTRMTATPRFEKVSDHVYFLESRNEGANVAAVMVQEGFLLINPPAEPGLQSALDALRRVAALPVRWVVHTDYLMERSGGGSALLAQGAAILASSELRQLASAIASTGEKDLPPQAAKGVGVDESRQDPGPRISFTRQMRLFPDNLEIRITAVQHKAHTSGDVLIFIPAEKVLVTGDLFAAGSFPEIDAEGGGSALGWIDGLKQAIDSVPLLKSAMPPPKPDPNKPPPEEKTLEEKVVVIPGRGARATLQEMKDLLEVAVRLRNDISRAVGAGRSRESILNSPTLNTARSLTNFEAFAARLFDDLSAQKK